MAAPARIAWLPSQRRNISIADCPVFGAECVFEEEVEVFRYMHVSAVDISNYENPNTLAPPGFKLRLPSYEVIDPKVADRAKLGNVWLRIGLLKKNDAKDLDPAAINGKLYCASFRLHLQVDTVDNSSELVVHPDDEVVFLNKLNIDLFAEELKAEQEARIAKPRKESKKPKKEGAKPKKEVLPASAPKAVNVSRFWGAYSASSNTSAPYWIQVIEASDEQHANSEPFYSPNVLSFVALRHVRGAPVSPVVKRKGVPGSDSSSGADEDKIAAARKKIAEAECELCDALDEKIEEVQEKLKKQKKTEEDAIVPSPSI